MAFLLEPSQTTLGSWPAAMMTAGADWEMEMTLSQTTLRKEKHTPTPRNYTQIGEQILKQQREHFSGK